MKNSPFPFKTVADRFHLIDSDTRTVYIPAGEGAKLVERLRAGECSRSLFRQLGQYAVNVYDNHFHALVQTGSVELLADGSGILLNAAENYSALTGLTREPQGGGSIFI